MKSKKACKKDRLVELPINQTLEEWAIVNLSLACQVFGWSMFITETDKEDRFPGIILGEDKYIRKVKRWVSQSQKKKQGSTK